jgi:hypothetical protein
MTYADDTATILRQQPPLWAHRGLSGPPLSLVSPYSHERHPLLISKLGPSAVRPPCALKRAPAGER